MHFCLTAQYTPQALNNIMDNPTTIATRRRRGRDASCPAPPAQIRTCTFMHPAPTSGN
jgi:hypothetical protein